MKVHFHKSLFAALSVLSLSTLLIASALPAYGQQTQSPSAQEPSRTGTQSPAPPPRAAAVQRTPFPHYADKARGWHWKEQPPEPDPEPEPLPLPALPSPPPSPPPEPAPPPGPKPFSSAWVKENLPRYMEIAIDDPTPQNVSNYIYLQRFAMDSADRFSSVYQRVATVDPLLDENRARPTFGPAAEAMTRQAEANKVSLLKEISQRFGIWFFFRSDCAPCHQIAPILHTFASLYGFSVLPVSVDHGDLPNNPWKRFVKDAGQGAQLQLASTPTLYLASTKGEFIQLSDTVISIEEMARRVIEMAADSKAITEQQYASTRATAKQLMPTASALNTLPQQSANDPAAVREYLRSKLSQLR